VGLLQQNAMPFLQETEAYTPNISPSWLDMKVVLKRHLSDTALGGQALITYYQKRLPIYGEGDEP
jgi:hypothetical protein